MRLLTKIRQTNTKLKSYLKVLEYKPSMFGLGLDAILVVPVQRIPRYVLLLQDMVKSTPDEHADKQLLETALRTMKELADYINAHKRESDKLLELEAVKAKLEGMPFELSVTGREYVKDGNMLINKEKRHLFLFTDIAVIATADVKKGKHKVKTVINLKTAAVQREDASTFKLASTEGLHMFQFASVAEFEEWGKLLDAVLESARDSLIKSAFANVSSSSDGSAKFLEIQEQLSEKKRLELLGRLVDSEREYVEALTKLSDHFLGPVRDIADPPAPIITVPQAQSMISNLEQLVTAHQGFLQDLEARQKVHFLPPTSPVCELTQRGVFLFFFPPPKDWAEKKTVTDLFEEASFLRAYGYYVSHHTDQIGMLDHALETNHTFAAWVKQTPIAGAPELKRLLELPLRRVPEYYLLMQEMEQNTSRKSPDCEPLQHIVSSLSTLNDDLAKKSSESKHQTLTGSTSRKHSFVRTVSTPVIPKKK